MTAQFSDSVSYSRKWYSLTGYNGKGLFDPTVYGMKTRATSSACWRGFVCEYRIKRRALWLDTLRVGLDVPAGDLLGIKPDEPDSLFDAIYRRMNYKVPYTGGLLLARGFIRELYVHMGFHPAWKFEEVHELIFAKGDLIHGVDCSEEIAGVRERMLDRPLKPAARANRSEIENWIKQCFTQEYQIGALHQSQDAMVQAVQPSRPPEPVQSNPIFLELEHPAVCSYCQTSSVKYRQSSNGRLICLACGSPSPGPSTGQYPCVAARRSTSSQFRPARWVHALPQAALRLDSVSEIADIRQPRGRRTIQPSELARSLYLRSECHSYQFLRDRLLRPNLRSSRQR
jgi:hypothetical protein